MTAHDRVNQAPERVRLTAASRLKRYKTFIKMNWRSRGSVNPVLMRLLGQTTNAGSFTHVVLDKLDDEGVEVSMRAAQEGEEGAVPLGFSPSGQSAVLQLSFIVAEWPGLRVQKGRLRSCPVAFRDDEDPPYLVLKLKESTIELSPKKKSGSSEEDSAGENQVATAQEQVAAARQG